MPGLVVSDTDSRIRVVVTPSQSSYFAGEPFSVNITFTNTHSPEAGPSRSFSHTHKRGAHSISSAPLSRPPTSPGTPRTPLIPLVARTKSKDAGAPSRRGLVGTSTADKALPELIEQRRRKMLAKSLSVSITPPEFEPQLTESTAPASASSIRRSVYDARHTPTSPHVPSPLARTDALPLSHSHPHARKQSVVDGDFSLNAFSPGTSVPPSPYAQAFTPNSSTSTFSLALDPIAEASLSSYPSTPTLGSPSIEPASPSRFSAASNTVYAYPPPRPSRHAQIGLGQPPNTIRGNVNNPPRTAFSSTFPQPNTELILYSYAQLSGTVTISPVPGAIMTPEQSQTLNGIRAALLKRSVIGGGSMDINSSVHQSSSPGQQQRQQRSKHGRSSSFTAGFLSILSPTSLITSISTPPSSAASWTSASRWRTTSHTRSPSGTPTSASFSPTSGLGLGLGLPNTPITEEFDSELPLPTFEVQPAMLAVDLSLLPGESRSYVYTIILPDNLPPTFNGKALKFSYELVVGICRSGNSESGGSGSSNVSRVMKVPIRMYNNVVVSRPPKPYNLLWPVHKRMDLGMPSLQAKVTEGIAADLKHISMPTLAPTPPNNGGSLGDIRAYAQRLLDTLPNEGRSRVDDKEPSSSNVGNGNGNATSDSERNAKNAARARQELERDREDEGSLTGCKEAVEILTRNPKKVSYDVSKDGVKVAVLTFTKSAYRLGETVTGVVELNERKGRARVLQLSSILEAHEALPPSVSPPSSAKHLKRTYGEHFSSFLLNTLRTTFCLDIPSDASPAFQVSVGTPRQGTPPNQFGGVEWKVRLCLLVAIASENSETGSEGVRFKGLLRDRPRGEWDSSWHALDVMAPLEKPSKPTQDSVPSANSWGQFFASYLQGETEYHDGDDIEDEVEEDVGYDGIKPDFAGGVGVGVDFAGGEEGWREAKLETVECEVPIKVWPGNTAFKAMDVVFDV